MGICKDKPIKNNDHKALLHKDLRDEQLSVIHDFFQIVFGDEDP
jgi:translation initiation factor 6 (eIF-6)